MSIREVLNKAKREKKRAQTVNTAKKIGVGLGIGAAIGSAFGLLFAPKSGKETRKDIADAAKNSVENIKEGAGEMGEKISKVVEEGKEKISNIRKNKNIKDEAAAEGEKCCDDNEACCGGCADMEEIKEEDCCED